jgi:hypothetical protein
MATLPGWSSKDPKYLCPCVREKYLALLNWSLFDTPQRVELTTIETARDEIRQAYYKKIGVSRTLKSKHLPPYLAFDIAPTEYLSLKAWNPQGPLWKKLGAAGEKLGLEWGGRWESFPDLPHFQLSKCECPGD